MLDSNSSICITKEDILKFYKFQNAHYKYILLFPNLHVIFILKNTFSYLLATPWLCVYPNSGTQLTLDVPNIMKLIISSNVIVFLTFFTTANKNHLHIFLSLRSDRGMRVVEGGKPDCNWRSTVTWSKELLKFRAKISESYGREEFVMAYLITLQH